MSRRSSYAVTAGVIGLTIGVPCWAGGLPASADSPWGREQAAHLLRRAGFGGTPQQIDEFVAMGRDRAVDSLVDYESVETNVKSFPKREAVDYPPRRMMADLDEEQRRALRQVVQADQRRNIQALRAWWLGRMIETNRPLEEKMTLFWHGHFTSGFREVRNWQALHEQNEFLRKNALSDFRTLLVGISRDPAMLRYLDNARNVKGKPNENYARELMELFTLGEGQYTEADVKAAARAFTGWGLARGRREFEFHRRQHDFGKKTFLGREGDFDGTDIIDILLEQPAAARYMAGRLWEFFADPEPDADAIEALAASLRASKYDFRKTLRTLFRSDAFYSDKVMRSQVKSPVELMVGTARLLETGPVALGRIADASRQLGQDLFQPPNVKGWDGGRKWINTSTLFLRYNFAGQFVGGSENGRGGRGRGAMMMRRPGQQRRIKQLVESLPERQAQWVSGLMEQDAGPAIASKPHRAYDPTPVVEKLDAPTPRRIVEHYVDRLLQMELPVEKLDQLTSALSPEDRPFGADRPDAPRRVREVVALIMSMPEYQVN